MFTVLPLLDCQLGPLAGRHERSVQIERRARSGEHTVLGPKELLLPLPLLRLLLLLMLGPGLLLLLVGCLLHPTSFPHPNQ